MSNVDVMGIHWWREDDGIHYACRGIGPTYMKFYNEWVPKSSYRCTDQDFPWDYFMFDDPADHDRLIADFGNDIVREDKDTDDE